MNSLPNEIVEHIFSFLPVTDRINCIYVCKKWAKIADSDELWRKSCGAAGRFNKSKNWKVFYKKRCDPQRLINWQNVPVALSCCSMRPEMQTVACCNGKIYLGASRPTLYAPDQQPGLYCYDLEQASEWYADMQVLGPKSVGWNHGTVNHLEHFGKLLAAGCSSDSDNVVIWDTDADTVVKTFTHEHLPIEEIGTTFQHKRITKVKWAKDGSVIFSSCSGRGDGVCMWDVESGHKMLSFDHKRGRTSQEPGMYGTRNAHEIYGLCPTQDGRMFVSSSYRHIYQWDTRMNDGLVNEIDFYPPTSHLYPLEHLGFTNPSETLLTVVGKRESKCITYEFPSMETTGHFKDFLLPGEMTAMCFTPFTTCAADIYGSTFIWSNIHRGEATVVTQPNFYIGSGANGIALNEDETLLAISMSNPQSGWNGGIATIYSVTPVLKSTKKKKKNCVFQ